MDSELRSLERELRAGGSERHLRALERARLRAGVGVSLHDFLRAAANAQAFELVEEVAARRREGNVFLDGPTGTGKTLLLRAVAAARADSWLWSGVELEEGAARAIEAGEALDLPRLLVVDDLVRFTGSLGDLLRRSMRGRSIVAAGPAARAACEALGGRFVLVGPLEESGRRELLRRSLGGLAARGVPDELPLSGFELLGVARRLALEETLGRRGGGGAGSAPRSR